MTYRWRVRQPEFLLLHRAASGPDSEGEWAWTPPGGNREEDETIDRCATRELREETGFDVTPWRAEGDSAEWFVYTVEVPPDQEPCLSDEHDRHVWLPYAEAAARVLPAIVRDQFVRAARVIEQRTEHGPRA
ncbi:MAG TPA: NUDIX domain-containing protein [Chloroflexota bacterium]|nr:NUDIX domain-containing protein [Chloroflexota bacterium]